MPTYISLINWTDQGIRSCNATVERANSAKQLARRFGGEITATYWTVGPYDIVTVAEFPDEESGTAFLYAVGSGGSIRSTTLRAFSAEETTAILGKLP